MKQSLLSKDHICAANLGFACIVQRGEPFKSSKTNRLAPSLLGGTGSALLTTRLLDPNYTVGSGCHVAVCLFNSKVGEGV